MALRTGSGNAYVNQPIISNTMNSRNHLIVGLGSLALTLGAGTALAQTTPGQYAWEEFGKRIKASEKVSPLGSNFAGDQVSLSNGSLSFRAVDVSIPGNSGLPVEFARKYSVFSRKNYQHLGMLADWVVDVPSLSGVFAPDWVYGVNGSAKRCSTFDLPVPTDPLFHVSDFWQGVNINLPGAGDSELLRSLDATKRPADGKPYFWTTSNGAVHLHCLDTIKNGAGEGFVARTADGKTYWFDWMGQTNEPTSHIYTYSAISPGEVKAVSLVRRKNYLYATKVTDRFGNEVNYTYTNDWNQPGRLSRIQSSDGRTISVAYSGEHISTVTALWKLGAPEGRVWRYSYVSSPSGRPSLSSVQLNDGSEWKIDLAGLTSAEVKYPEVGEQDRSCTYVGTPQNHLSTFVGSIKHPAGATAEFTLDIQEHGSSFVPINCRNVSTKFASGPNRGVDNVQSDDINWYATSSNSLTLKQKKVSGPGLQESIWNYSYQPNNSIYMYPGTSDTYPVCDSVNYDCSLPPCTNDDCALFSITTVNGPNGEWSRYFHGNTYRYNEGKLLRVESGSGPDSIVTTKDYKYNFSTTGASQPYPARFGYSLRLYGDGFASEYHRPQVRESVVQQGVLFERIVNEFDGFARPISVTRRSQASAGGPNPPPTAPPAPSLTAPASSYAEVPFNLGWTAVAGGVRYELERSINGSTFATIYSGAALSSMVSHPSAANLTFRVRACNKYGNCGTYSLSQQVRIDAAIIGAPSISFDKTQVGAGSPFAIRWSPAQPGMNFILERRVGLLPYVVVYSGASQEYFDAYGPGPVTLFYRVKACSSGGVCGAYSAEGSIFVYRVDDVCDPKTDPDCDNRNRSPAPPAN